MCSLIVSPRHTPADLKHWQELERSDRLLAQLWEEKLLGKAEESKQAIASFFEGNGYGSVSWGADSTVLIYLAWEVQQERNIKPKFGYVKLRGSQQANPDCDLVRDAFLSEFPVDYGEIDFYTRSTSSPKDAQLCYQQLAQYLGRSPQYMSGIRAQENHLRAKRLKCHGLNTKNSSAPLLKWTKDEIFAFLSLKDLPVTPVYGMTMAGAYPRELIRTSSIGGVDGTERRRTWEMHYYRDIIQSLEPSLY